MNFEPYYFSIAISLHTLAAVVWVGGMFFAYMALRPVAAKLLEPAVRLSLWSRTLSKFFIWVWLAVIIIPVTGYWMIFSAFNACSQRRKLPGGWQEPSPNTQINRTKFTHWINYSHYRNRPRTRTSLT
jgi:hypothetical protein